MFFCLHVAQVGLEQEQKHQQTFGFWLGIKAQTVIELLELCGFSPGWKAGQASRTEGRECVRLFLWALKIVSGLMFDFGSQLF